MRFQILEGLNWVFLCDRSILKPEWNEQGLFSRKIFNKKTFLFPLLDLSRVRITADIDQI